MRGPPLLNREGTAAEAKNRKQAVSWALRTFISASQHVYSAG